MRYKNPLQRTWGSRKQDRPLRYAAYCRCSTDDQAHGDFTTIDSQKQANVQHIQKLIAERDGMGEMMPPYVDDGKSGTNLNRPEWKRLIADAQAKKIDVVVVTFMSRLGRGDAYTIAAHYLKEAGVEIEIVKQKFSDDASGYIGQQATIMMDGALPKFIGGHVRLKQERMVAMGYFTGGQIPFGMRSEAVPGAVGAGDREPPRQLVPDEGRELPLLIRAYEIFANSHSYAAVRTYLREVAPTRNQWHLDSVRLLLCNEVYRGVLQFGPHRNEHAHPIAVPEYLWDQAQEGIAAITHSVQEREIKTQKRREGGKPAESAPLPAPGDPHGARASGYDKPNRSNTFTYYLRGRVFCETCGYRMTPATCSGRTDKVAYYNCQSTTKGIKAEVSGCCCARVNAYNLHVAVMREIEQAANHPSRLSEFIGEAVRLLPVTSGIQEEVSALARAERDAQRRADQLVRALEKAGTRGLNTVLRRLKEVEDEITDIKSRKTDAEERLRINKSPRPDANAIAELWRNFTDLWEDVIEENRSALMSYIVESVTMTGRETGRLRLRLDTVLGRAIHSLGSSLAEVQSAVSGTNMASVRNSGVAGSLDSANYEPSLTGDGFSRLSAPKSLPASSVAPAVIEIPLSVPKGGRKIKDSAYKSSPRPSYARRKKGEGDAG